MSTDGLSIDFEISKLQLNLVYTSKSVVCLDHDSSTYILMLIEAKNLFGGYSK